MNELNKSWATSATEDAYAEIHETLDAVEKYLLEQDCGGGSQKTETSTPQSGFGGRVRALREKLGLSQADFARRYGLDLGTLSGWEQGRRKPDRANQTLIGAIEVNPSVMASLISKSMPGQHNA